MSQAASIPRVIRWATVVDQIWTVPKASGVKIIKDTRPISITPLQNRTDNGSGMAETLGEELRLSLDEVAVIYDVPRLPKILDKKSWLLELELRVGEPLH